MRIFLLAASVLVLIKADEDIFSVYKKDQYCGNSLRMALQVICRGVYKRTSADSSQMQEDWVMNFIRLDEPKTDFPFRSRAKALAIFPKYSVRQKRGVVDECCKKACTIDELQTYCG